MNGSFNENFVPVSCDFIENLMPNAPALYTVVYLCALKAGSGVLAEDIARRLNISSVDVLSAAMYWQDRHVLNVTNGAVYFDDNGANPKSAGSNSTSKSVKKHVVCDVRPEYQPEELNMYADKNADVRRLFNMAQEKLGKMLTHNDLSAVFSFYHWLGMSLDVIEMLFDYCVSNGHRNMRYIERVAIDWCESGINTVEGVKDRIYTYNTVYRKIMRAFGQNAREPVSEEINYMDKWVFQLKMPEELILLACSKTVINTGRAAFGYANSIIESWNKSGYKSKEDVEAGEKAFAEAKKAGKVSQDIKTNGTPNDEKDSKNKQSKNKFINYSQRTYNYAELERLQRERFKMGGEI